MLTKESLINLTYSVKLTSVALVCALGVMACSSVGNSTFSSLVNTGIVPVSADNPFMGSNIFLAKEMEESDYLYNFMKEKGAPQAIELLGSSEQSAELQLFYSGKQEVYHATPQFNNQLRTKEWIVRGPYIIERTAFRQIADIPAGRGGVFEIFGRREVLGGELRAAQTRVIAPAFVPTPKPVVRRVKNTGAATAPSTTLTSPSNFDQQAIAESRGMKPKHSSAPAAGPAIVVNDSKPFSSLLGKTESNIQKTENQATPSAEKGKTTTSTEKNGPTE